MSRSSNDKGRGKRTFPRKKLNLDFDLMLPGEQVPAVITDFSLCGMGILVKGRSDLSTRTLDLNIRSLDVHTTGRIVWKQEIISGIKVGVICTGPLAGRLRSYSFADLVIGIYRSGKTGVLTVTTGQWSREIFFKGGEMVYAASDINEEQLGSMLLSAGRISLQQYESSLALARETGKSQGAVLVEMRHLTPSELVSAVRKRVEAIIMNLCCVDDAEFTFREGNLPEAKIIMMKLNSGELLYRGYKRIVRPERVRNVVLTPGMLLHPAVERESMLHRLSLNEQEKGILAAVGEYTTFGEVLSCSPLKEDETLRIMAALINARVIDMAEELEQRQDAPEKMGNPVPSAGGQPTEQEIIDKIDLQYARNMQLDYYGVLGLQRRAVTPAELKRAYHAMAKEYHPDRYLHLTSPSAQEKLNSIFAFINEAYRVLSKHGGNGNTVVEPPVRPQESPEEKRRYLAQTRYREGRACLAAGDIDEAVTLLGQAAHLGESVPEHHFFYGVALFRAKKFKEAEEAVRKAVHLAPHKVEYITELGYVYLKLGFKARARTTFEKALKLDPSNSRASKGLGQAEESRS